MVLLVALGRYSMRRLRIFWGGYLLFLVFTGCSRGMVPILGVGAIFGGLRYACRENRGAYERDQITIAYRASFSDISRAVENIIFESQRGTIHGVSYRVVAYDTVSLNSRRLILEDNKGSFVVFWNSLDSQTVGVSLGFFVTPRCVAAASDDYQISISRDRFFFLLKEKLRDQGISFFSTTSASDWGGGFYF